MGTTFMERIFKDARDAIEASGYTETVFADDMNAFKNYDSECTDATIMEDLQNCQFFFAPMGSR